MTEAEADPHHISAYKLGRQIGSGAFGQVYLGTHHRTGQQVAVKLEPLSAAHPQLPHEARLYKSLSGDGVCQMYWHGTTEDGHYALILELLGPSAEELLHRCRSTFSIATVSQLAITLLDRFEFIHSRGIVHRDVKPQNLAAPRSMSEAPPLVAPPLTCPGSLLGRTLLAPGCATHSGRASQPLRAQWVAAVRPCGPAQVAHPAPFATFRSAYHRGPMRRRRPSRGRGGLPPSMR